MTGPQALLVCAAGVAAGAINTVVGSGTLITFPTLLAVGLTPISANVSNTLGLAPGSLMGAYGYRRELAGQRSRAIQLGSASVLGAVAGAVLLLVLPSSAFEAVVPALIGLAVVLVIAGPWLSRRLTAAGHHRTRRVTPLMWMTSLATAVYGGYFGAAQGVLLVAVLGLLLAETLQRMNGLKNLLTGVVNAVAAIVFVFTGRMDWAVAGLIAAGSVVGAVIGARVGRRLPAVALRAVIAVVGLIALVKLLID